MSRSKPYKAPETFHGQNLDVSPFDTPEAKARTAFNNALIAAMPLQIEADKRRTPVADQVGDTQG